MIINLKLVLIRIILLSIVVFILCKIAINIRKNFKLLKFYDYKTKQLTIDKLNELNNIEQLKKDIMKNEEIYNTKINTIKSSVNSYSSEQKKCKNHKLNLFDKLNNFSNDINTNLMNKFNLIDEKYNNFIETNSITPNQVTNQANNNCYLEYCNNHRDLKNAFCAGIDCTTAEHINSCKNHWRDSGKKEGRNPNPEICINKVNKLRFQRGGLNNEICVFPQFSNYKKDNKCCPKSFSNSMPFASKKRCSTDNINNKTMENFDNPINSCKKAGGYVSQISKNNSIYICNSYLKNLKGGDAWIQLGDWRLGYTKHDNIEDNNFYFTLCNHIQKKNIFIIDNYYNFKDELILNQDALFILPLLNNINNINVGNGYIEFAEKWRLGYYDDSKLLLSAKNNNKSYCWDSNGNQEIINYNLWSKDNISSNIYFDGKQEILRFGNYWYMGQYDDKFFSISNKLSEITNISYTYNNLPKYTYKDVIKYENCIEKINLGKSEIDRLFKQSNIFRFKNHNETIFYHRITSISHSIYDLMIKSFTNVNNELNKDFKLYNNLQDLENGTNFWNKCNYEIYTQKLYHKPINAEISDTNLMNSIHKNCNKQEFIKNQLKPGEGYYFNPMDGSEVPIEEKNKPICRSITIENTNKIRELQKEENYKPQDWKLTSQEDRSKFGFPETYLPKSDENIGFPANCGQDIEVSNRWARMQGFGACSQSKDFIFTIVFPQNTQSSNYYTGQNAQKYSLNKKNLFEEYNQLDALTPIVEDIHLEDIDTELKVQLNNNCPFPQLEDNCPIGKDCLYQKCCPLGFNNTKYNSNYKQCSSTEINDILQLNCENAGGRITENIVEIENPNFLQKQKKLIYNCVNKSIEEKYNNIKYYALLIVLILAAIYLYIKLNNI
jgi:hypothetical protein